MRFSTVDTIPENMGIVSRIITFRRLNSASIDPEPRLEIRGTQSAFHCAVDASTETRGFVRPSFADSPREPEARFVGID